MVSSDGGDVVQPGLAETVTKQVAAVRKEVAAAALRSGRSPDGVKLVAVTKSADERVLTPLLGEGIRDFAENRWQDARDKLTYAQDHLDTTVVWHFIGRLQRNKVKYIVPRFAWIHSIESESLAQAIADCATAHGVVINGLVQVNISGESTKAGLAPEEVRGFLQRVRHLSGVAWRGLMTMAPETEDVEQARAFFRQLRVLRDEIREELSWPALQELSMGMSNDFAVAVEEGATIIRVGRRIVGARLTT